MKETGRTPALILKINALLPSMSKSERRVAQYIVDNSDEVIYLSISQLAEKSGVSDATVVRTCQKIGSGNYQNLKVSLAQDIVTPLQSINEEVTASDSPDEVKSKVFLSARQALQFTGETLSGRDLQAAADALLSAEKINVIGFGNSHAVALDAQHKLMRLGLNATDYMDSHMQIMSASFLTERDALLAISYSGSSNAVISVAKEAKKNGAKVISITNIGRSPLYDVADIRLSTAAPETRYRIVAMSSRIAQMAIIDTLYTLIALKKPDSIEGFRKLEKAMSLTKY